MNQKTTLSVEELQMMLKDIQTMKDIIEKNMKILNAVLANQLSEQGELVIECPIHSEERIGHPEIKLANGISWDQVLQTLKSKISAPSYETWLKSTKLYSLEGDNLTILALNEFARDWLEGRYTHLITTALYELTGKEYRVSFTVQNVTKGDVRLKI